MYHKKWADADKKERERDAADERKDQEARSKIKAQQLKLKRKKDAEDKAKGLIHQAEQQAKESVKKAKQ